MVHRKRSSYKELGASMVEYSLLVALVAVVSVASAETLGRQVSKKFSYTTEMVGGGCTGTGYGNSCGGEGHQGDGRE